MAIDLTSATQSPKFKTFTGTTALTEIILPPWARYFSVYCKSKNVFVCNEGGIDGGTPPTDKSECPKNNSLQLRIGVGSEMVTSMFVSTLDGTAEITVTIEE